MHFGDPFSSSPIAWSRWWQLCLPPRLLFLGWRFGLNILPTLDNLRKKQIIQDSFCPFCASEEETVPHLFKDCSVSRALWFGIFGARPDSTTWNSGIEIIFYLLAQVDSRGLSFVLRWLLKAEEMWHQRNLIVFTGNDISIDMIIRKVSAFSSSYMILFGCWNIHHPLVLTLFQRQFLFSPALRAFSVDGGFDSTTNSFHWAAVSWSINNLPHLFLQDRAWFWCHFKQNHLASSFFCHSLVLPHLPYDHSAWLHGYHLGNMRGQWLLHW